MTQERAKQLLPCIQAFAEGKQIQYLIDDVWQDVSWPEWNDTTHYRIKPEFKKRLMTRNEILYFILTTPAVVVRYACGRGDFPQAFDYEANINLYEWAMISKNGTICEWHKFEVEE